MEDANLQGEEVFHTPPSRPHFANLSCYDWRYGGCATPALWRTSQVRRDCWRVVAAGLDLAIVEHWRDECIDVVAKKHERQNASKKLRHVAMSLRARSECVQTNRKERV